MSFKKFVLSLMVLLSVSCTKKKDDEPVAVAARGTGTVTNLTTNNSWGVIDYSGANSASEMTNAMRLLVAASADPDTVLGTGNINGVRFRGSIPVNGNTWDVSKAEIQVAIWPGDQSKEPYAITIKGATGTLTAAGNGNLRVALTFSDTYGELYFDGTVPDGVSVKTGSFTGTFGFKNKEVTDSQGNPGKTGMSFEIGKCGLFTCQ